MIFKILDVEFVNGLVKITTDYKDRPVFVYPENKFTGLDGIKTEIERSILFEKKKIKKFKDKSDKIKDLWKKENPVHEIPRPYFGDMKNA